MTPTNPDQPDEQVFTGEWLSTFPDGCACHEFREGYTGTLAAYWNGWAVFTVTAAVMRAIVTDHQRFVLASIVERTAHGEAPEDAWRHVHDDLAAIYWLGDLVVIDSRALSQDPHSVEIVEPDDAGRYKVGFSWTWEAVKPTRVHTVHNGHP